MSVYPAIAMSQRILFRAEKSRQRQSCKKKKKKTGRRAFQAEKIALYGTKAL